MKVYIMENIINMNVYKDLSSKFKVVFVDDEDVKIKLDKNMLYINNDIEVDCSNWINKIKEGNTDLKLSGLIDTILKDIAIFADIFI